MNKEEKAQIIEKLAGKFKENNYFYIADASGLSVMEINAFRRMCFERGVEYRVFKNTMIKKALEQLDADYAEFSENVLKGFSGIMFSPAGNLPAKIIKEYRKKGAKKPIFKGASIDSEFYIGEEHLTMLSTLKSKNELIGEIIELLQSPISNVLGALESGKGKLAGIIKTLSEKEA